MSLTNATVSHMQYTTIRLSFPHLYYPTQSFYFFILFTIGFTNWMNTGVLWQKNSTRQGKRIKKKQNNEEGRGETDTGKLIKFDILRIYLDMVKELFECGGHWLFYFFHFFVSSV